MILNIFKEEEVILCGILFIFSQNASLDGGFLVIISIFTYLFRRKVTNRLYLRHQPAQGEYVGNLLVPLFIYGYYTSQPYPSLWLCYYSSLACTVGEALRMVGWPREGLLKNGWLVFAGGGLVMIGISMQLMNSLETVLNEIYFMTTVLILYACLCHGIPMTIQENHALGEIFIISQGIAICTIKSFFCMFDDQCEHMTRSSLLIGVWMILITMYFIHIFCASFFRSNSIFHAIVFYTILVVVAVGVSFSLSDDNNPILWTIRHLWESKVVVLVGYWISVIVIFYVVFGKFYENIKKSKRTRIRKLFHLLAIILFLPAFEYHPLFFQFAVSAVLALFIVCEYVRYFKLPPFGKYIHFSMVQFTDAKDRGMAITTHIYLLLGCATPLIFGANPKIPHLIISGTLLLGVGDSMASLVGSQFGTIYWLDTSKKSVQGSLAALFSMIIVMSYYGTPSLSVFIATVLCVLFEACTPLIDNLVLPLFYAALLFPL